MGALGAPEILILAAIALVVGGIVTLIVKTTNSRQGKTGYTVYPPQVYTQTFIAPQGRPPAPPPQPAAAFCGHCGAPTAASRGACPACGKPPI